jgi:GNAT superfamily N-acetyltransferase
VRTPSSETATTSSYSIRPATIADADALVHHRLAMSNDMGVNFDAPALAREFRIWLAEMMGRGTYRAWVVEDEARAVVAGGGITILPWPPGPNYPGAQLAFVYNVYTEPASRRRGLARLIMETIHAWCRTNGITSIALNASRDGQPLYEAMGYVASSAPMMFLPLAAR